MALQWNVCEERRETWHACVLSTLPFIISFKYHISAFPHASFSSGRAIRAEVISRCPDIDSSEAWPAGCIFAPCSAALSSAALQAACHNSFQPD